LLPSNGGYIGASFFVVAKQQVHMSQRFQSLPTWTSQLLLHSQALGFSSLYRTEPVISLQVACVQREKATQKQMKSLIFSVLISYSTEVHYAVYHSTWYNHQIGDGFC
jgi:hypothetical protein